MEIAYGLYNRCESYVTNFVNDMHKTNSTLTNH